MCNFKQTAACKYNLSYKNFSTYDGVKKGGEEIALDFEVDTEMIIVNIQKM